MKIWRILLGGLIGLSIAGTIASKWHEDNRKNEQGLLSDVDIFAQNCLNEHARKVKEEKS